MATGSIHPDYPCDWCSKPSILRIQIVRNPGNVVLSYIGGCSEHLEKALTKSKLRARNEQHLVTEAS